MTGRSAGGRDANRRRFLRTVLGGSAAAALGPRVPLAAGPAPRSGAEPASAPRVRTDADIERLLPALSNWGRWGKQDEIGTLNFVTPELRRRAAALVRSGRTVTLAREVSVTTEGIRRGTYEMMTEGGGSRDFVGMIFHGFALTHLDALCHAFTRDGRMYNGYPATEVGPQGARRLGMETLGAQGICGRGVLLDVAFSKGGALEPGTPILIADLESAEAREGIRVGSGDLLFVRTGAGIRNTRERRAGLHPECLTWLHSREVAVLGSDGDSDVAPLPGFERFASAMHSVAIPYLGLPLLDNASLDTLGQICQEEKRWQFLLTIAPWRIRGTTSSPVNPIAVF